MKRILQGVAPITVQRGPTKDVISLDANYELNAFAVIGSTDPNTLGATFVPALVLVDGLQIKLRAALANTGAATFNANGTGALALTKLGGTDLAAGDISAAGHELILRYRSSVPRWELLNPAAAASAGGSGISIGLASQIPTIPLFL